MFFIVFYHLILWFVHDNPEYDWVRAFWIPLHIGVVCFILISGYWGIRPSSRGLLLYLGVLLLYSIPDIVYSIRQNYSIYGIIHSLQFVSKSKYWFARTYLGLYLIAPLLNRFLESSSRKGQWYLLIVLSAISIYLGNFSEFQAYLDGKNLINFMLVYVIGYLLHEYSPKWKAIDIRVLILSYLFLNGVLVFACLFFRGSWLGDLVWKMSFPYNSPFLILNAVLFFSIIGKVEFSSSVINSLATNCFSIYLIHGMTPLMDLVERPFLSKVFYSIGSNVMVFIAILFFSAILIMLLCSLINQAFSPLWKCINRFGGVIQARIGF